MLGKVKRFNKTKGYGFITLEDGRDVFFHYSELVMEGFKTVDEGAAVEFDLFEGEKGLQAHNIKTL
ncbi:MAG: cold shock domain-containing protein [Erysipelotrichaceae bacterium]|nr:cold shock domain-containing protein [Erysipelotrichaceae bacterium]MBQ1511937.1 cold shock domain-containing protein [Erysipelotrichaceae bacterium]MBQ1810216.1 cold shock domain-containing protein [Erysipelotrichaceae bacterium]MBQ5756267.1 cold shock domain-containing protein [Erysipelotrichaceae bacterium]MBR3151590.1 cold shock domain-containing protein [Erysipelotrichaceae bacterium]